LSRPSRTDPPRRSAGVRRFVSALVANDRRRLAWVVTVQLVTAVTQGVGLVMLVPLLAVAGVGTGPDSTGRSVDLARDVFDALGLPLSLRSMLVAYVLMVGLAAGLTAYHTLLAARYRLEFVDALRQRAYGSIARAEWRHLLSLRSSDLLTSMSVDVTWVAQAAAAALNLAVAVVLIAVQLTVALGISPGITALAALTGGALTALVWPLVARSRRLGQELVGHNRNLLGAVTGFLDGLKLAKAHGLEAGHLRTFDEAAARTRRSQLAFTKAQASATAIQLTVTAIVLAVIVDVAVAGLGLPLAELLVLAFIFMRLVPQITHAQSSIQTLAQALPHFESVQAVIDDCERAVLLPHDLSPTRAEPRRSSSRPALADRLVLDAVAFSYQRPDGGCVPVLNDVSIELPARRTTALVGPSGAGKTTVADLALGLLLPSSGRVLLDGVPLAGELLSGWRTAVAMVPQDPFLFHDSIRANLRWARAEATEAELWEALTMASAADFVGRLPDGLDTVVGDRGGRLSGGERQRIVLARALLRRPELLVLDEATNSLDPDNERVVLDAIAALHGQMTVLLISHQESAVRIADQTIVLAGGRVVGSRASARATP
jgi:ATP-binding cassette subfamily C protein